MNSNPILEEIWRIKDALARDCDYDVDRMFDALQRLSLEEERAGRRIIHSAEELRCYAGEEERQRAESESVALRETPPAPDANKPARKNPSG